MGRKPRKQLSPARRVLLIGGIVFVLLAGWYVWWLFLYRPAVEYPKDWPLEFVTVPEGAWAERIPPGFGEMQNQWSYSTDWETTGELSHRSWVVGFQYPDSLDQAMVGLIDGFEERGYSCDPGTGMVNFYSSNLRFEVSYRLFPNEDYPSKSLWDRFRWSRSSWIILITEFDPPIDPSLINN